MEPEFFFKVTIGNLIRFSGCQVHKELRAATAGSFLFTRLSAPSKTSLILLAISCALRRVKSKSLSVQSAARVRATRGLSGAPEPFNQNTLAARKRSRSFGESWA